MGNFIDLTGQRFGRLTVIERAQNQGKHVAWLCQCDCGKTTTVKGTLLRSGKTQSCGCIRTELRRSIKKDLTGQRFGRLLVLGLSPESKTGRIRWRCLCDCGKEVDVNPASLMNGQTQSCGCLATEARKKVGASSKGRPSKRLIDLTGKRFGRLTVQGRAENTKRGQVRWRCLCDCGKETIVLGVHLRSGHTQSCGCMGLQHATEAKIKHGESKSKLYAVFQSMHRRCDSPTVKGYKYYGAKGIRVCAEWEDFETFANWAKSHGYKEGLTIDRKDPNKGYEPENCEWVTRAENSKRMHRLHNHKVKE